MNAITTKHALDFLVKPWDNPLVPDYEGMLFVVGTCHGLYDIKLIELELNLIGISNDNPGNGHIDDVFQWFEFAAKAQGLDFYVRAIMNQRFKKHLLEKRGFTLFQEIGDIADVVKKWKDL